MKLPLKPVKFLPVSHETFCWKSNILLGQDVRIVDSQKQKRQIREQNMFDPLNPKGTVPDHYIYKISE